MYGIGNRPAFANHSYGTKGTKSNTGLLGGDQPKRYYSSLDAEIYFGDFYIDEVVQIQYSVQQNVLPMFGYNSYVYDEVAVGSRLIQGVFTINFTSPGYLFDVLKEIDSLKQLSNGNTLMVEKQMEGSPDEKAYTVGSSRQSKGPLWGSSFQIDVMFGGSSTQPSSSHVVLEDAVITGSSMQLDPSGNPIAESYNFIAKDIRTID